MKRLAAAVALALALAGSAAADTFRVLPATGGDVFTVLPGTAPAMSGPLPSADSPNAPGSIAFPDSVRSYPLVPETRTYAQLLDLWQQSGAAYGVSWEVLAAINKIESNFGRNMGPSSAGAIGWMQFMPSTWERWGLDGDGDGIANPWSPEDAIPAAARYLAASGGQADISRAIFSYNHAQWYVDEVQQLAQLFNAGGVDVTFNLDKLQISLDKARAVVVKTNRKLVKALRSVRALARHERALQRRAVATRLLSDRFALDRRAAQAGVVRTAAQARVDDLRATLAQAETDLASARDRSLASSFSPAAGSLLGAPSFDSGYVFPVGGGPSTRLGLALPPRLSRGRHRRSGGLARVRAAGRDRPARLDVPERELRNRPLDSHRGRPELDVLPPLVPRPGHHPRGAARRRHAAGARRLDGPRHRPAPAPAARPDHLLPAGAGVVPELRGHRVPLAGRRPDGLRDCGQPSIHGRTTGRRSSKGFGCPLHPLRG